MFKLDDRSKFCFSAPQIAFKSFHLFSEIVNLIIWQAKAVPWPSRGSILAIAIQLSCPSIRSSHSRKNVGSSQMKKQLCDRNDFLQERFPSFFRQTRAREHTRVLCGRLPAAKINEVDRETAVWLAKVWHSWSYVSQSLVDFWAPLIDALRGKISNSRDLTSTNSSKGVLL